MTEENALTIQAHLDAPSFRRQFLFDALVLKRAWLRPAVFAVIMLALAAVCFVFQARQRGAALLGAVLLVIGLGLPGVFFLSLFRFIRRQCKRFHLDTPQLAAVVTLSADGVLVEGGQEPTRCPWDSVYGAYRRPDAVYLYLSPTQALLLSDADAGGHEAVWDLLVRYLPQAKLHK